MATIKISPDFLAGPLWKDEFIDGIGYQAIVEADFLVNLFEDSSSLDAVRSAEAKIFRTDTGKRPIETMPFGE